MKLKSVFFMILFSAVLLAPSTLFAQDKSDWCRPDMICGQIVKVFADSEDFESSSAVYMLRPLGQKRLLRIGGNVENIDEAVNKYVNVEGVVDGHEVIVKKINFYRDPVFVNHNIDFSPSLPSIERMFETGSFMLPPRTRYVRSVYVVRVKFAGDPDPSPAENDLQVQQMTSAIFTGDYSVNKFFHSASFSQFSITGVVHPTWIEIPYSDAGCESMMIGPWSSAVFSQLTSIPTAMNANTLAFSFRAIPSCTLGANGTLGVKGSISGQAYIWQQLTPQVVADNYKLYIQTFSHEMGHNWGLNHAGVVTMNWTFSDSGDVADFMASRFRYPNLFTRLALGWAQGRMTTFFEPREAPYESVPWQAYLFPPDQVGNRLVNGRNSIAVLLYNPDGSLHDKMLLLEVRRNSLFDPFYPQYPDGAIGLGILYADRDITRSVAQSHRIDATPGSIFGTNDAFLPLGQSITIPNFGVRIEAAERTMTRGMRVLITMPSRTL